MKEPTRLIDASTDPTLVLLLRAGRNETPSDRALRRTLQAVAVGGGVAAAGAAAAQNAVAVSNGANTALSSSAASSSAGGLLTSSGTTVAGAGITGTASAGAVSLGAKVVGVAGIAKWAGLGALTAASVTLVPEAVQWVKQADVRKAVQVVELERAEHSGARAETGRVLPVGVINHAPDPVVGALEEVTAPQATPIAVASSAAVVSSAAPNAIAPDPSAQARLSSDFAAQVELVEQARRAIAQNDAGRGLTLLAGYENRYSRRQLLPEVLVLRLEALVQMGRMPEARAVARRILQRGTTGAHATRAQAILVQ